jgi:hypothetical protein
MGGRASLTLAEGMTGMMENVLINVKNKSKTITAEIELPPGGANGTLAPKAGASAAGRSTSRTACRPTTTTSSA